MKLVRLLVILLFAFSLLLCSACGKENGDNNQNNKENQNNGENNTANTMKREPQGKTSFEKLCWLLEDMGFEKNEEDGMDYAMDYIENLITQMNQGGAIITEENFQAILNGFSDGIEESYVFEGKSYRTECIASLNNKGIKTLANMMYGCSIQDYQIPEYKEKLNESGILYDNCWIVNKCEELSQMIDRYLENDAPTLTIYEGEEGSAGLEYRLSKDGTFYILTGIGTCTDRNVVIPNMYKGKPVRIIDDSVFEINEQIVSVKIGDNVELMFAPFVKCPNLISVTFGKGLAVLPSYAFDMCYNILEIYNFSQLEITKDSEKWFTLTMNALDIYTENEPSKLDIINNLVFYVNADSVKLAKYIGSEAFINLPQNYNGAKYGIMTGAFSSYFPFDSETKTVVIPNTVDMVEKDAFEKAMVYCQAPSKPAGWHENWAGNNTLVEWGYQE
ncbi:MAG: leucine-rich repeat protein [Clostridia bacterium]|nr:leucine-rich repeat protein [Clostridia bacterium]